MKSSVLLFAAFVTMASAHAARLVCTSSIPNLPYTVSFDYNPYQNVVLIDRVSIKKDGSVLISGASPLTINDKNFGTDSIRTFALSSISQATVAEVTTSLYTKKFHAGKPRLVYLGLKRNGADLTKFLPLACSK